jgi:hypothetical protein
MTTEQYTVVRQLQPGYRSRQPFNTAVELPQEEAPEHIAHATWDVIQEYWGRVVPDDELFRRIRAYEMGSETMDFSPNAPRIVH